MRQLRDSLRGASFVYGGLGMLFGAVLVGATGQARYGELIAVPAKVAALETWKQKTVDPALQFLVCSQRAINEGKDPRPCEAILQGLDELLRPRPR